MADGGLLPSRQPRMAGRRKLSIVGENRHFTNDPVLSEIACYRQ